MNEPLVQHTAGAAGAAGPANINLIDILIVFAQRKRVLIAVPLVVALVAALLSLLIPNAYKATTKILPPQQAQSSAAALLSQLGGVAGAAAGAAGVKNPNDTYIGMLKSRTVADSLIARFKLKDVYGKRYFDATRKELEDNTAINSGKDGLIAIDVEDEDAERSAALANAYAEELLRLTKVLAVTEAAQRRLFFERQLEASKNNLANAEVALKAVLGTHGVISVDSESRAIVETVARLRAQIAAKEIQLGAMRAFVTNNNQEYKRSEQELGSMRSELARLENGRPDADPQAALSGKQAGLENIKLLRDIKYHQMLYELLAKQYEIARLDEAKDASIIQVLDKAQVPERKFKPKRLILTMVAGMLGLFFAIIWVLLADARQRVAADPGNAERVARLRRALGLKTPA